MGSVNGEEVIIEEQCSREEERIVVSVRMRPLNEKEVSRNEVVDWECMDGTTILYKNHLSPDRTMYPTSYTFDRVFRCDCSTRQVYEEGAKSVVLSAVSGINSSVFAYGQTSSGKTFTMSGITEYTMEDIFDYVQKHKEREFQLKFSAMEIYNESVRDLLSADNSSLRLLDDPERGTVVERLTEITLYDWNHFKELLIVCEAQRQIGETFLNEASSRSHQILRLTIESSTREFLGKNNSSHLTATLDFVDLAGSERASQALSAGSRLKEGSHINRSLLTLGTVIRKLSKGRTGHIPYRDSKLTRILQSSLGGNARTAIICTMSPARSYVEQSRNTLLFASCAKEVATSAHVNVVISDKVLVKHLQRQLAQLENELRSANPSVRADASDLLREKDSKIEELERYLRELTLRLDLALSQINDLRQEAEHRSPPLWEGEYSYYPRSHVQPASESFFSDANFGADRHSFNGGSPVSETPHSPDRQSRLSYDDNYSVSDFEENQTPGGPFEQLRSRTPSNASSSPVLIPSHPNLAGLEGHQVSKGFGDQSINVPKGDPYMVFVKMGEQSQSPHEIDRYKVSEENRQQDSNAHGAQSICFVEFNQLQVSDEAGEQTPMVIRKQDDDRLEDYCKEVQCIESAVTDTLLNNSLQLAEDRELFPLTNHEKIRHTNNELNRENEMSNINTSSIQDPKKSPGKQQIDVEPVKNLNYMYSSDQSDERSGTSSAFVRKSECGMRNEHKNDGDNSIASLKDVKRNLSALKHDADSSVPHISEGDIDIHDISVTEIKDVGHLDCSDNLTSVAEMKDVTKYHCMNQVSNVQSEDGFDKASKSMKNMNDVGVSAQVDLDVKSPLLSSDFKRLQEEIIDLWDTCYVSLVHRTYFFQLFIIGDSEDTIYMEVERRRFSFIKDAFSWGTSVVVDGRKLTPGSSKRCLQRERDKLGRLIKKRFSSQERIDLYVKWGISLDAKRRSSQLAHRLWSDTTDMEHIKESANIIAKLARFSKPQVPKEVFGLNLTNLGPKNSFRWKHNLSLVMQGHLRSLPPNF